MYWLFLCGWLVMCSGLGDDFFANLYELWAREGLSERSNLSEISFPALKNNHNKATTVTEDAYPWIARVVHSRSNDIPHICTASCIDTNLFVTAARCIFHLKVEYMTVYFRNANLPVRALVVPTNSTKQMFDDIGIIVIDGAHVSDPWFDWPTIKIYDLGKRTDDEYMWFEKLHWNNTQDHYVVGYAASDESTYRDARTVYTLTELHIYIDMKFCNKLTSFNRTLYAYWVPCYHSCVNGVEQPEHVDCEPYHGVEGAAVIDKANNSLIGIVTWGGYHGLNLYTLPVGFSFLNSDSFFEDLDCALKIRDSGVLAAGDRYQTLCT